jgi:hypothetical protein
MNGYDNPKIPGPEHTAEAEFVNPVAQPITVMPGLTVYDECGTANDTWEGVPTEGISYRVWEDAPAVTVIAQPEPGYTLNTVGTPFGLPIGDAGGAATALITFTDVPCESVPGEAVPIEPVGGITELPATGWDGVALAMGIVLLVAGAVALVVSCWGGRVAELDAEREAELDEGY